MSWGRRRLFDLVKGDDIAARLIRFGKRILRLCRKFPRDFAGRHASQQLIRAAFSAGSNYEEARGAESIADLVHKLGVSRKEIRESIHWLRLADQDLIQSDEIGPLVTEGGELVAILTASMKTAKSRERLNNATPRKPTCTNNHPTERQR